MTELTKAELDWLERALGKGTILNKVLSAQANEKFWDERRENYLRLIKLESLIEARIKHFKNVKPEYPDISKTMRLDVVIYEFEQILEKVHESKR